MSIPQLNSSLDGVSLEPDDCAANRCYEHSYNGFDHPRHENDLKRHKLASLKHEQGGRRQHYRGE